MSAPLDLARLIAEMRKHLTEIDRLVTPGFQPPRDMTHHDYLLLQYRRIVADAPALIAAAEEAERLRAEAEWQPIETAPRDGAHVLLYLLPNEVPTLAPLLTEGYWQAAPNTFMSPGYWRVVHAVGPSFKPTHWRPLPTPPAVTP